MNVCRLRSLGEAELRCFPTEDSGAQMRDDIGRVYCDQTSEGFELNLMVCRPYWYRSRLLQQYMHRIRYRYGAGRRMSSYQV